MNKRLTAFIFFATSICIANAQPYVDILNIHYQYFPSVNYKDESKNKLKSSQFETTLLLPIERKNKDVILAGANYSSLHFDVAGDTAFNSKLTSASLFLGYNKQWKNEKWKTLFMFIPKVNAQLKSATSNDYQWGGVLLFDYKKKENLRYHFGVYYNREYFGDFIIPLLGIEWKIDSTLNLFGDLPNNLNLEKKFCKNFYSGLIYTSAIASYRNANSFSKSDYVREGDKSIGDNQLKLYFNYYIAKYVVVYAEAGHTLGRFFQSYHDKEIINLSNNAYHKTDDSFLFNAGIAMRVRLDKTKQK